MMGKSWGDLFTVGEREVRRAKAEKMFRENGVVSVVKYWEMINELEKSEMLFVEYCEMVNELEKGINKV